MSAPDVDAAVGRLRAWITPDGAGYYYPEGGGELESDLVTVLAAHVATEAKLARIAEALHNHGITWFETHDEIEYILNEGDRDQWLRQH